MAKAQKQSVGTEKITTGNVIVKGYNNLITPSTLFDAGGTYNLTVLVSPEIGEKYLAQVNKLLQKQRKAYGGLVQECTRIKPYVHVVKDKDTKQIISETPDAEGRYGIKLDTKAYINDGVPGKKILLVDAQGKPILKDPKLSDGSVVKAFFELSGYTVAGKTGVSIKLKAVQVITVVEYGGTTFEETGFSVEEDGYSAEDTEYVDSSTPANESEEDEQEDF